MKYPLIDMRLEKLSTYPQKEERKKVPKKERRKTTTTNFCQPFSGRHISPPAPTPPIYYP